MNEDFLRAALKIWNDPSDVSYDRWRYLTFHECDGSSSEAWELLTPAEQEHLDGLEHSSCRCVCLWDDEAGGMVAQNPDAVRALLHVIPVTSRMLEAAPIIDSVIDGRLLLGLTLELERRVTGGDEEP